MNFTQDEPGELIGGSRFKPVDQFLLPKVEHAMLFLQIFVHISLLTVSN